MKLTHACVTGIRCYLLTNESTEPVLEVYTGTKGIVTFQRNKAVSRPLRFSPQKKIHWKLTRNRISPMGEPS